MPIKLKLSLSAAGLIPSTPAAPVIPATPDVDTPKGKKEKGKGKAKDTSTPSTGSRPSAKKVHGIATNAEAGPSALPIPSSSTKTPSTTTKPTPVISPSTKKGSTPKSPIKSSTKKKSTSKLAKVKIKQLPLKPPLPIPSHVLPSSNPSTPKSMGPPSFPLLTPSSNTPHSSNGVSPAAKSVSPSRQSRGSRETSTPSRSARGVSVKQEVEDVFMDVDTPLEAGMEGEDLEMDGEEYVKDGVSPDPLSVPFTSAEVTQMNTPQEPVVKQQKIYKKPLNVLIQRILVDLRRRDDYLVFEEPVNPDDFPGYLEIIGGEENMMDLSTMQSKLDSNDYTSMEAFRTDLLNMTNSAKAFNPEGSIPHKSATTILNNGLRQIDRYLPMVETPEASPERDNSQIPQAGREMTINTEDGTPSNQINSRNEVPPNEYIPIEMLAYPPESSFAKAVGWSLTGGRKFYARKDLRVREKFYGKWRHWDLDGSLNISEIEDINSSFYEHLSPRNRMMWDWKGMRKDGIYWNWPGLGGMTGQPPVPVHKYPERPKKRMRRLDMFEWGVYPEIEAEKQVLAARMSVNAQEEVDMILGEQLRMRPGAGTGSVGGGGMNQVSLGKIFDDKPTSKEFLYGVEYGDVKGEAYIRSVNSFVDGAINSAQSHENLGEDGKDGLEEMRRYIKEEYNGGVMSSSSSPTIMSTIKALKPPIKTEFHIIPSDTINIPTSASTSLPERIEILKMARAAHARTTLRWITRPSNELNMLPLLSRPEDFMYIRKENGVTGGLEWVGKELERLFIERTRYLMKAKQENGNEMTNDVMDGKEEEGDGNQKKRKRRNSGDSSPLSTAPDSPQPLSQVQQPPSHTIQTPGKTLSAALPTNGTSAAKDGITGLNQSEMDKLRLEILALCKFYPLTGLKKMSKGDADRLLPINVRKLLTVDGST